MKKVFKQRNYILLAILLAVVLVVVIVVSCRQAAKSNEIKSSIEMGDRYLAESDYEQVIV